MLGFLHRLDPRICLVLREHAVESLVVFLAKPVELGRLLFRHRLVSFRILAGYYGTADRKRRDIHRIVSLALVFVIHDLVLPFTYQCGRDDVVPLASTACGSQDTDMDDELLSAARAVRENAHAPYSGFKVGAALISEAGNHHVGCNVENVAYPEGTCAEAGAIAAMIAAGDCRIAAIAVIADSPAPVPPCGGCRQKIAEFAVGNVPVILATIGGEVLRTTVADLLPGAFDAAHMGRA